MALRSKILTFIKQHIKSLLFILGVGILITIFTQVPWLKLWSKISQLSFLSIGIILIPRYLTFFIATIIGYRIFQQLNEKVSFRHLLLVRTSTEPFQFIFPGGNVAGDPVRILMLKSYGTATDKSAAGFILLRLSLVIGSLFFYGIGVVTAIIYFGSYKEDALDKVIEQSSLGLYLSLFGGITLLLLVVSLIILFIRISIREGIFTFISRKVQSFHFLRQKLDQHKETITNIDDTIRGFYTQTGKPFLLLRYSLYVLATFLVYFLELYFILTFLGFEITLIDAFILQSFGLAVQNITRVIPGGVGAQEGGFYLIYALLGFEDPLLVATSYAIIVRGIEIFWITFGGAHFGLYSCLKRRRRNR